MKHCEQVGREREDMCCITELEQSKRKQFTLTEITETDVALVDVHLEPDKSKFIDARFEFYFLHVRDECCIQAHFHGSDGRFYFDRFFTGGESENVETGEEN